MEALDFVGLAVSKDESRYNLMSVYRDSEHFVATDGHRLHYSNGLPKIEQGHYLNGLDAEFPEWSRIVPKTVPEYRMTLRVESDDIKRLKALMALAVTHDKKSKPCTLKFDGKGGLRIKVKGTEFEASTTLRSTDADKYVEYECEYGLNIGYLIDVLESAAKFKHFPIVKIRYHGEGAPFTFSIPMIKAEAVIMPMRLKVK